MNCPTSDILSITILIVQWDIPDCCEKFLEIPSVQKWGKFRNGDFYMFWTNRTLKIWRNNMKRWKQSISNCLYAKVNVKMYKKIRTIQWIHGRKKSVDEHLIEIDFVRCERWDVGKLGALSKRINENRWISWRRHLHSHLFWRAFSMNWTHSTCSKRWAQWIHEFEYSSSNPHDFRSIDSKV